MDHLPSPEKDTVSYKFEVAFLSGDGKAGLHRRFNFLCIFSFVKHSSCSLMSTPWFNSAALTSDLWGQHSTTRCRQWRRLVLDRCFRKARRSHFGGAQRCVTICGMLIRGLGSLSQTIRHLPTWPQLCRCRGSTSQMRRASLVLFFGIAKVHGVRMRKA